MREIMLNLSAWIERRADNLKPYADHIIHSVKAYEAEIERLRHPEDAQVRVKRDILSECIHTAFRRASDHESAEKAHQAISEMPESEWTNIISFIEHYALEPDTVTGWQDISDPQGVVRDALGQVMTSYKAKNGREIMIEDDEGERVWLLPNDAYVALNNLAAPEKEG